MNNAGFPPDGSALSSFRIVSAFRKAGGVARLSGLQAKATSAQVICPAPAAPQLTYSLRWLADVPLPDSETAVAAPAAGHAWTLESGTQRYEQHGCYVL